MSGVPEDWAVNYTEQDNPLCPWHWGRPKTSPKLKCCLALEVIIQTFIYSTSQNFFPISQELLEKNNKDEKSQLKGKQKYGAGFLAYYSALENQDTVDQTPRSNIIHLLIWISWITSCYLKITREGKKELPKHAMLTLQQKKKNP